MFQLTNYRRKCLAAVYIFLVDRVVDWADEDGEGVLYPRQRNTSKNIIIFQSWVRANCVASRQCNRASGTTKNF